MRIIFLKSEFIDLKDCKRMFEYVTSDFACSFDLCKIPYALEKFEYNARGTTRAACKFMSRFIVNINFERFCASSNDCYKVIWGIVHKPVNHTKPVAKG